jgi:hypothetical protein
LPPRKSPEPKDAATTKPSTIAMSAASYGAPRSVPEMTEVQWSTSARCGASIREC